MARSSRREAAVFAALAIGALATAGCRTHLLDLAEPADLAVPDADAPTTSPWPMFQHDPAHSGRSAAVGPATPSLRWTYAAGGTGTIEGSPAIAADGTIYAVFDQTLHAIRPDGTKKWARAVGMNFPDSPSPPALAVDGTIYVGSSDGHLYAIDPAGAVKWTLPAGDIVGTPVVAADGTIYAGSLDEHLYAVNPDGTQKWSFHADDALLWAPAVDGAGTVYVGSWRNYSNPAAVHDHLFAINPDGTQRWAFEAGGVLYSPAIGSDGTIYVRAGGALLDAVRSDGKLRWQAPVDIYMDSAPAVAADGTVYVGSGQNQLTAFNPDGSRRWTTAVNDICTRCAPSVGGDGTVYVSSFENALHAFAPDGSLKWSTPTGKGSHTASSASVAIDAGGVLYIGADDANLYAIGR